MSYENAVQQMKKLERKGYFSYGDSSTKYCLDPNVYCRFFTRILDNDEEEYLKTKIREYLDKEDVVYNLSYSLQIVPDEEVISIVENAKTYSEMAMQLNRLPYVSANGSGGKLKFHFIASYNGKTERLNDSHLKMLCDKCNDDIYCEMGESTYGKEYVYLHSRKCEDIDNFKNEIDELF